MSADRKARWPRWRGFTLLELIVVLVVLAILVGLAAFGYQSFVSNSRSEAVRMTAAQVAKTVAAASATDRVPSTQAAAADPEPWADDLDADATASADATTGTVTVTRSGWCALVAFAATVGDTGTVGDPAQLAADGSCPATAPGTDGTGGTGGSSTPAPPAGDAWVSVTAGYDHACGITNDGVAWCWGSDGSGKLGNGDTLGASAAPSPVAAPAGVSGWQQLTAGASHTCGVSTDGDGYCWGSNGYGERGTSSTVAALQQPEPVTKASPAGGWAQLSAGGYHTCGVAADQTAHCWGYDALGQLGNGSTTSTLVSGGQSWRKLSTGRLHTCGATTGNDVFCWGDNGYGQLGDGTKTQKEVPTQVTATNVTGWSDITAGGAQSCALTTSSVGYCWGDNSDGELGNGTVSSSTTPSKVLAPSGVTWSSIVTADGNYTNLSTCAVASDGAGYCWGDDSTGAVGNGGVTTGDATTPQLVADGHVWDQVSAGLHFTCGVTAGQAFCWGEDGSGQLGNGSAVTADQFTPVQVPVP